jgi:hypothetical protein
VGDGDDYQQYYMPTIFYRLKNENEMKSRNIGEGRYEEKGILSVAIALVRRFHASIYICNSLMNY